MSSKYKILTVILGLLISSNANAYYKSLSPSSFDALYSLAAHGNISAINSAIARGLNINSVNQKGDTGLCVAAKRRDRKAFKSFIQTGANPSHPCTWEIRGYRDFMEQAVYENTQKLDTATNAKELVEPGMSWKTKTLIGAGVVAAGAGAALALGGGGSGGGSDVDPNCVHGTYINGYCTCYPGYVGTKCDTCDTGYVKYDNNCYKDLDCGSQYGSTGTQKGGKCVCRPGYAGDKCDSCAPGYGRKDPSASPPDCVKQSPKKTAFQKTSGGITLYNNANFNYTPGNKINGVININNDDFQDVYGMFYDAGKTPHNVAFEQTKVTNNYNVYTDVTHEDTIIATDENGKQIWDENKKDWVWETVEITETLYNTNYGAKNQTLNITNNSDGDAYGIYSNNAEAIYNNYTSINGAGSAVKNTTHTATINITRETPGNGNNYGIYSENKVYTTYGEAQSSHEDTMITLESKIYIYSYGTGKSYGIYNPSAQGEVYNTSKNEQYFTSDSSIFVINFSNGDVYGIYGLGKIENSGKITSSANHGNSYGIYHIGQINVKDSFTEEDTIVKNLSEKNNATPSASIISSSAYGQAYGIWAKNSIISNEHVISASAQAKDKNSYGIYATNSYIFNSSGIYSTSTNGDAYGIYNKGGKVTNTTQIYEIVVNAANNRTAYGIYSDGGEVVNSGRIQANGGTAYGIYAINGAKVTNKGEFYFLINGDSITPDNISCTDNGCKANNGQYAIYLTGGAKFVNEGSVSSTSVLSLPQGTQISTGGSYSSEVQISGDLAVASKAVSHGFENTYTLNNAVETPDASNLKLSSESVLFDASLEGSDIVLNKKGFDKLVDNKDVAKFLEQNYAQENNEQLFAGLKSATSIKELNKLTDTLTGQDIISRFTNEDLIMSHELDFDMNEKLFNLPAGKFSLANDISTKIFDENGSRTSYMLSGIEFANAHLGVGLAIQEITSSDDNNNNARNSQNFQFMAPLQFKNKGFNTVVTPKLAYAYGTYDRNGYEGKNFEGTIEKQTASVSAETRYPFKLFGLDFAPASEINLSAYQTKISEDANAYALSSDDTTYSANFGMGAYLSSSKDWAKNHKLSFMAGAMLYHEFADPYALKMKINGMNGSFTLRDENRQDNYIVLRSKFDYTKDNFSLYGDFLSYADHEFRTRLDVGFKYHF